MPALRDRSYCAMSVPTPPSRVASTSPTPTSDSISAGSRNGPDFTGAPRAVDGSRRTCITMSSGARTHARRRNPSRWTPPRWTSRRGEPHHVPIHTREPVLYRRVRAVTVQAQPRGSRISVGAARSPAGEADMGHPADLALRVQLQTPCVCVQFWWPHVSRSRAREYAILWNCGSDVVLTRQG